MASKDRQVTGFFARPPIIVAPYDAELFGHWWYEGPEFLDFLVRKLYQNQPATLSLLTPGGYLRHHPTNQIATPGASSWGEEGYWRVWLDESNEWIYPHLQVAQKGVPHKRILMVSLSFPQLVGQGTRRPQGLSQTIVWTYRRMDHCVSTGDGARH